ncbi:hypothetical protein [Halorarum halobium]|uniref:hypothetical protein n=1 Tax=Halorarum halobium TaxID=3075121 RepID=UPI0028AE033C|nr:hypothetical protein [Halobaculum sp. XH14]
MVTLATGVRLAGAALGAIGGMLVFIEFMQLPSYVEYRADVDSYDLNIAPQELREHTWMGRVGGLLVGSGFALLFLGELL